VKKGMGTQPGFSVKFHTREERGEGKTKKTKSFENDYWIRSGKSVKKKKKRWGV